MAATRLYFTASVEEQWHALAGPWLRAQVVAAWRNPQPTVILTPSRAEGFYLRARLLEEGISFLGLRFWTPSDARKFLLAELLPELGAATQAELRLVARACAEKMARTMGTDHAPLTSVIREPGPFLRADDLLLGAGWNPAREGALYGRDLAGEMQRELARLHIATQAGAHRQLLSAALSRDVSCLANVLVVGFNATHWPLWDLLKAVVFSAADAVVALSEPRVFAEEIDQLWISSWEDIAQTEAVSPVAAANSLAVDEPAAPLAALVASYEQGARSSRTELTTAELKFCVTPDLATQIRAVVLQALDYLRSDTCSRLGIVFPEANALALGVAEELRRLGIPLDDGIGSPEPGLFEKRCWRNWIALQEEPGVPRLIAWLRACEAQGVSWSAANAPAARNVVDILESALGESLVDDLGFLARFIEDHPRDRGSAGVAEFLRQRIALPEAAAFAHYLALTREALDLPGWEEHLACLRIDPPAWLCERPAEISRRTFLEWLKESTASRTRTRGLDGNHFYGKIHLLIYAQMTGQTWSHLILTGLNEGVWPRTFDTGAFGSRRELAELNQQARVLNRRGERQGGQGMGHDIVGAENGHCLLPLERQDLALRDLCAALESTRVSACLAAMTTDGGRSLLPSDFFEHAYQFRTGEMLDEKAFGNLARTTETWCRRHDSLFLDGPVASPLSVAATEFAHAARRDPAQPFGPYEFSYAEPPSQPIQLSCKRWEDAWNHPATVWLEEIVGAAPWPEGTLSWPRAIGTWVHRWLAAALTECRERNSPAVLPVLIWAAADREAATVRNLAQASGMELYPWWEQVWNHARTTALGLGDAIAPYLLDRQFLSELRVADGVKIALTETGPRDFVLKGRIDLLLIEPGTVPHDFAGDDFSGCACWVIDFKTGAAQSLTAKKISQGTGLQPLLYALAMRESGAVSTAISLQTADAPLQPQVRLELLPEVGALFRSLDQLHRDGVFGMRADADNAYGFSPSYPMATRFVAKNILAAKWALVHGSPHGAGDE